MSSGTGPHPSSHLQPPFRVVYLDHCARLSGGEIALVRLIEALGDHVEAHVILGEDGPLVARLRAAGARVEVLPLDRRVGELRKDTVGRRGFDLRSIPLAIRYLLRLRRRLRQLNPHVVHTNSLKSALYGGVAARLAGLPVIWHVRDRIAADYLPRPAVALVHLAARFLPTTIVGNSQTTLATLPRSSTDAVVANAIVNDTVTVTATASALSSQRDAHRARPRFGVLGRLTPWKGQHVFVDALAAAFPGGEAEGWLIGAPLFGEDDYARALRDRVERLGLSEQVTFRGFRADIWAELAELDVLVHCSTSPEPFGQVVVEGMAAGVPVIAAAAGGPAEIIRDGHDGLLVPPDNVPALAAAMRRLADSPGERTRLATAGHATAATFSPARTAEQMIGVYRRTLAARATPRRARTSASTTAPTPPDSADGSRNTGSANGRS